jgi:metallo-beta-lactamase family protein
MGKTVTIRFHGAAGTVTGSCFEFRANGKTVLVDCGLFQGTRSLEALNHEAFAFDPQDIDAVILTHAHLDHSGRLPCLIAQGCTAPIWCTAPTADILEPLLLDAAKLHAADVERRNRRSDRIGMKPFQPLYSADDVVTMLGELRIADYCDWVDLGDDCGFRFWDARHIVGSASVELRIGGQRILISGDIGGGGPARCVDAELGGYDHILCESTYGDRNREPLLLSDRREQLAQHVEAVLARGGNLLIPAFALERTQAVLEDLVSLIEGGRLKAPNIFVDSPLAERVTRVTLRYRDQGLDLLNHPQIRFIHDVTESKMLNNMTGAVILAGSGMCQGGRIRHHLVHNLPHPQSRVLLVGYQVAGTLGAVLRDGARHVRISGNDVAVRAEVKMLDAYSNHADQSALLEWMRQRAPVSGNIFLVHGEEAALTALAKDVDLSGTPAKAIIPALGESWKLWPARIARRVGKPRADVRLRLEPRDWAAGLADLQSGLGQRLRDLPSDKARERAIAALNRALQRAEGR